MNRLRVIFLGRKPLRTLIRCAVLAVMCIIIFGKIVRPAIIDGPSMEPTIPSRGFRFVYLQAYKKTPPERFDVVAIRVVGNHMYYLKRILGLPGERIEFRNGKLYIDHAFIDEPHVIYQGFWTMKERELASDEFFISGDNRSMPMAFHKMGVTRRRHIAGRLL